MGRISKSVIRGRIIAVDSQEPVSGVKVKIKRLGTATTNSDGRYKIRVAKEITGKWQVVISAPEYWRRKTWLVVAGSTRKVRADWNILPQNSTGFDLELFNAVTRGSRERSTARWEAVPAFRILANRLDCPGTFLPGEDCPEWIVTSSTMNSTVMEWFSAAMEDVPALVGGGATPTVEIIQLPPNTSITTESILVPGAFTFGELVGLGMALFPDHGPGDTFESHVYLISAILTASDRGAILRRVAQGLGYLAAVAPQDLCANLLDRGMKTIFCLSHGLLDPTDLDAAIGRALYTRAIGNRYPDIDPEPRGSP